MSDAAAIAPLDPPIAEVLDTLYAHYGRFEEPERDDILATLIATLLSQATTDANSSRAFGTLLDTFEGDWHQIAQAPVAEVAQAIRVGGLANQKAPRIQHILRQVHAEQGTYSLEHLHDLPPKEAMRQLLAMPGVGPKTASFVLMRAANMPFFAMDTHILRFCERIGWTSPALSDTRAHAFMLDRIPEGEHDAAHVAIIDHGRACCHARSPRCEQCPLRSQCPWPESHDS